MARRSTFPPRGEEANPARRPASEPARPHQERESRMLVSPSRSRPATAAVELALVVPFLAFMFIVAIDFCRIFYFTQVVTTGARNGALYLSDPQGPNQSRYASLQDAVRSDASSDYA